MQKGSLLPLAVAAFFAACSTIASADIVETKSGARLIGKITKMDGVAITLSTDYAGDLTIKQKEVTSLKTDEPRFVRLTRGTVMAGVVTPTADGKIQISGEDGVITTSIEKVTATWKTGEADPSAAKWSYEATGDVTGKSGNKEQSGVAIGARAKRVGATDSLQFYTAYNRQETDGAISADQFKAGMDFANNFSGRKSWYVRDEAGFDRVKDIELYNIAATGMGYDFVKQPEHILTGRAGLAFRYEGYANPASEDVKSFGLDLGLHHAYTFHNAKLINDLTYMPSFNDFSNYRVVHESYFEVPLASPRWKLRLGVTNDYASQPGEGVQKLDTTYFTRFVLGWQ